jgi:hypothetical protein
MPILDPNNPVDTAVVPPTPDAPPIINSPAVPVLTPPVVEPPKVEVDPTKTTAAQLSGIINENSPLMQQAQTAGKQYANQRGLLSSSLGAQAAQESVLKAATPIAQSDANIYSQAANTNANIAGNWGLADKNIAAQTARDTTLQGFDLAKLDVQSQNVIKQLNVQQQNDLAKAAVSQGYDLARMDAQQVNELAKLTSTFTQQDRAAAQKFGYDKDLLTIQHQASIDVAAIEAQYKNLTQASSSAAAIVNNMSTLTNNILLNTNMDAPAKQVAIDQLKVNMQNALALIGGLAGDLNLNAFFDQAVP